jgi:AcrR family transcriptional regulator
MGMKHHQRRTREKQELRRQILRAARQIAVDDGWQAVTIRKIADQVEYSPAAIYEYFESKEAILLALMDEGFRALLAELEDLRAADTHPVASLVMIGHVYWRFAWQHPELYQIMHGLGGVPFGTADAPIEAKKIFQFVKQAVREAREEMGLSSPVTDEMIEIVWATLHGLVSLSMSGRIPTKDWAQKTPLVEQAVQQLINGWRT